MGKNRYLKFASILFVILSIFIVSAETQNIQSTNQNPEATILINNNNIYAEETIEITTIINPYGNELTTIQIFFGDGDSKTKNLGSMQSGVYFITLEHKYEEKGDYEIKIKINNNIISTKTINVDEIQDERPELKIISPNNNIHFEEDGVTFSFEIKDDNLIENCYFKLYSTNNKKTLEHERTIKINSKEATSKFDLKDFENNNYTWELYCQDNISQKSKTEKRLFSMQATKHEKEKEIEFLIEQIENFQEKEKTLNLEEKKILKLLEITKNLPKLKTKLIQIDQNLGNNIKHLTNEKIKTEKTKEAYEEIEKIKKEIPIEIEIKETLEYIKNELDTPILKTTQEYLKEKKIDSSKFKTKTISKQNEKLQGKLTVSSKINQVYIKFNSTEKKHTIIEKEIKLNDPTIKTILEILPETLNSQIIWKTKTEKINDYIYKINIDEINNNKIIYQTTNYINPNELKKTDTILFKENLEKTNIITGMAIFATDKKSSPFIIIISITILFILFLLTKNKIKKQDYKQNKETKETITFIKNAKENIKNKNIQEAKEQYKKIKNTFSTLPEKCKNSIYTEIEKIRIEIDKIEIRNFVREYEKAKKENRIEDTNRLYTQISNKYKRLPKKYQLKVYERIIKK